MEGQEENKKKKMKILCLHGFRTSGKFLQKQLAKWDPSIFADFDMDFPDGIFPAGGKSDIEGIFPPPYFEWFQYNEDFTEYTNLEECISYLCDYITSKGPFDGLLGFSQGANLSGLLLGYQAQGKLLKDHPPMKLFVALSGTKFKKPSIREAAYKEIIKVKSAHFIGDKDWLKPLSEEFITGFENPLVIRHPQGHVFPRLDEASTKKLQSWVAEILHPKTDALGDKKKLSNGETKMEDDKRTPGEAATETHKQEESTKEGATETHKKVESTKEGATETHKQEESTKEAAIEIDMKIEQTVQA